MKKETFLNYNNWFYAKVALLTIILASIVYFSDFPIGGRRGNTLVGYIFGIFGTVSIIYLTYFGIKKRSYHTGRGNLIKSLSCHIYLGTVLLWIIPYHSGFNFGANVHTLTYISMCVVIFSGFFGAYGYGRFPKALSSQRGESKKEDILKMVNEINISINAIVLKNAELKNFAHELDHGISRLESDAAPLVKKTFNEKKILDSLLQFSESSKVKAIEILTLQKEKSKLLDQLIEEARAKLFLRIWLVVHIPFTILLLVLLAIHIFTSLYFRI